MKKILYVLTATLGLPWILDFLIASYPFFFRTKELPILYYGFWIIFPVIILSLHHYFSRQADISLRKEFLIMLVLLLFLIGNFFLSVAIAFLAGGH